MGQDAIKDRASEIERNLQAQLQAGLVGSDTLICLHQSFSSRFASDNAGIWSTGAIFIPVALASPVAYFGLGRQGWGELLAFAASSLLVICAWVVIAENHRAFQNRSIAVMIAVERTLGLALGPPKLPDDSLAMLLSRRHAVRTMRRLLPVVLFLMWMVIVVVKLKN